MNGPTQSTRNAEQQTAYDTFRPDEYRVRIRDNGSHVAIMTWDMTLERFVRVNLSVEDFRRITEGVGA